MFMWQDIFLISAFGDGAVWATGFWAFEWVLESQALVFVAFGSFSFAYGGVLHREGLSG